MGQITSCLLTVQAQSAVLAAVGSRQCNLSLSRRRVGRTWHFDLASFQTVSNWPLSALGDKMAPPPLYMSGPFSSQHGCFAPIPNCLIFSPIPTYQIINLSAREAQQKQTICAVSRSYLNTPHGSHSLQILHHIACHQMDQADSKDMANENTFFIFQTEA